jgi:hypothetical protein
MWKPVRSFHTAVAGGDRCLDGDIVLRDGMIASEGDRR